MNRYFVIGFIFLLILIGSIIIIKEAATMFTEEDWEKEPTAILSCFSYGYKAKVKINEAETTIKGGQSEEMRLFYKTSKLAKEVPDEIKKYFLLNEGENRIQAEFTKTEESNSITLYVWLESEPIPSFFLYSSKKAKGKIDNEFIIKSPLPKDFKPVVMTDAGENKAVLIFVSKPAVVNATLNGKAGPTIGGTIGPIVLENIKAGTNNLTLTYQADPDEAKEIEIGVATPEWTKIIRKKVTGKAAKSENFTFSIK